MYHIVCQTQDYILEYIYLVEHTTIIIHFEDNNLDA